ncbi:carbonic anhydrase 6 [Caerostris darwini]|uniref:Carbonic anhydrase n=1 Tax=Caerostris darwini TaxID=1538125 RepID=A0AAV4T0U9_9ARAC|nr:carbonic anhydrase 6 [Caerostris darwini]
MFVKTLAFFINALFLLPSTEAATVTCKAAEDESWSYHGETNGPSAWGESFPTCYGEEQSPILIDTSNAVVDTSSKKLHMKNYDVPITKAMIINNGHSAQVTQIDGVARTIEVQGSVFTFQQLHFHWGSRYDSGSEHVIDDTRYALEAHFVHTNKDNTIAVVAVFFQATSHNNEGFQAIGDVLPQIPFKGDTFDLQSGLNLGELLPDNPSGFYHYEGSLTTPPCTENVQWFILKGVNSIGEQQLTELRSLHSTTKDKEYAGCKLVTTSDLFNL